MSIPYILYKTGPFDTITQLKIVECFQINGKMLKSKVVYFNDSDCYNFIKKNFGPNIVKAYDMLIPSAYKADLWRLCVLYIHGGIYGDLTQTFVKEYDVNKDNADIILVEDRATTVVIPPDSPAATVAGTVRATGIYNAFMAMKKRNGFIHYCIQQVVKQILMRNKGIGALDITGPWAIKRHYLAFFHVNKKHVGLKELKGIDNKIYRINIPFKHIIYNRRHVCVSKNNEIMINNYIENHYGLLYNHENSYNQLYDKNKIFKIDNKEIRRHYQRKKKLLYNTKNRLYY